MTGPDPLTASPAAIPSRQRGDHRSLGDCWRSFQSRTSPRILAGAIVVALALRLGLGHWGWRDAVVALSIIGLTPFGEWAIHVYLLHARPVRLGTRRRIDLPTAREHREHHFAPAILDGVLIPVYGVLIFLPMIAATVFALSYPVHIVLGGDQWAGAATGLLTSYAILGAYEWTHFLIHTPYQPRGRYFRSIWRNHRLHHYKNEHYWFGVTSTFGDRVIGTMPDQRAVPRSRTARSLHGES
ncbi:MAG TPA: sterol desaturase family protein [Solirubrobacteraceae bacterium]|nr:sterol desaturase family protein [Solirubrobacteraceae bacterium]